MFIKVGAYSMLLAGLGSIVAACAHDTYPEPGVATTTSANVAADHAVAKVAKSRCRRAAECNKIGPGQMYADKDDCMNRETMAAGQVAANCTRGIDSKRLDVCSDLLENEHCDQNLGQVAAMRECATYCAQ